MEANLENSPKGAKFTEQKITPKELFQAILKQWKWILLSLALWIGLAGLFLAWKQKSYTRNAQIEIKDEEEAGASGAMAMFADLGIGQATNNLYNEMAYFESPDLMEKVVERLGLQTNYTMRKGLRSTVLYGATQPVAVDFLSLNNKIGGRFRMKINEQEEIFLDKFRVKDENVDFQQKGPIHFGETVMTPLGKIKIEKTPFYGKDKEAEDEPIEYTIKVGRSSMKGAVTAWLAKLSVNELRKEASVVDLSVIDGSARRAEDVLNTIIQIYNEEWILNKNETALASSDFIDERLKSLSQELSDVDSDIADYRSENKIPDLMASASLDLQEQSDIKQTLLGLNNGLLSALHLKDYLDSDDNNQRQIPSISGISNPTLESQIATYNVLILNRNTLIKNSSADNPLAKDMELQLDELKSSIRKSVENQIEFIETRIQNYNKQSMDYDNKLSSNPEQARFLLSVERQQKVKENLYLYLLQKKEENQLNQTFTAYNTRIISRPNGEDEPTSPKPVTILAIAFIMGLAIPIGTIYVKEVSNTKVRDRNDLRGLSIPFLGEIPKVNSRKFKDKEHMLVVNVGNRNVVNEAFRVVRTNLNFMIDDNDKCPVVMVTSFNPSSGKSFVTVNLAMSLAIRGKKVLVIDGDMRRNSSSAYVGNPETGLAQCLSGKVMNVEDAIVKGKLNENFDMLPGGKTPPNPTELLENGRIGAFIEYLRKEYDIIFIDNAPIQMIADGRIFSTLCTNTIFVIRAGLFERNLMPELENVYRSKEYKKMSILLNSTEGNGSYGSYGMNKSYYAQND